MKDFEKWIKKAESDLLNIQNNLNAAEIPADTCCFHAQQVAEKYLKSYLTSKHISFPKTHDLELLLRLCKVENDKFKELENNCRELFNHAIIPRYPDDTHELTIADAQQAYKNAIIIKEFILKYFFD